MTQPEPVPSKDPASAATVVADQPRPTASAHSPPAPRRITASTRPPVLLPPKGHRDLTRLTQAQQLLHAYASVDYRIHWQRAFQGRGYAPYGAPCIHPPPHSPTQCPCHGSRTLIHHKQILFHEHPVPILAFVGGLGSGKSAAGCAQAVREAIDQPGSTGIVAAPTYKQLSAATKELFFQILEPLAIHKYDRVDEKLTLTNGSIIFFRSTEDPEPIRGVNAAWVYLDEGSTTTREAWDILIGRLRQPGYIHRAFLTTTPKGLNWVYDYFASPKRREGYAFIHATSSDNPYNDLTYMRRMKATFTDRYYQQEVLGEFVGYDGLVYPMFSKAHQQTPPPPPSIPIQTVYGHDFGFGHPNAIIVVKQYATHYHVVAEDIRSNLTLEELIGATKELEAIHGQGMHVCDHEPLIIQELQKHGFSCTLANKAVDAGIQTVASLFAPNPMTNSPQLLIDPSCHKLIDELSKYSWDRPKDGDPNPNKPRVIKLNDDGADALRYALVHLHGTDTAAHLLDLNLPVSPKPIAPDGLPTISPNVFSLDRPSSKHRHWMDP